MVKRDKTVQEVVEMERSDWSESGAEEKTSQTITIGNGEVLSPVALATV